MDRLKIDMVKYFDRTAVIELDKASTIRRHTYKDVLKHALKVGLVLEGEEISREESSVIGLITKKNSSTVTLLLAILEADFGFCFVTRDNIPKELNTFCMRYFFSDELLTPSDFYSLRNTFEVFGTNIHLYQSSCTRPIKKFKDYGDPMNRICYTITTSGTTGRRKVVRVTYNCIMPNVVNLQRVFRLDNDVIYSSAPCTFDVFVLDLFLAFHSGSTLVMIDESLRFSEESMNFLFSPATGVTFLQITPSLFEQYGIENIKNTILHPDSRLKQVEIWTNTLAVSIALSCFRFLVLGGEQFPPTKEVILWQDWDNEKRTRIFNIYGITEMSCWAMLHEVTKEDLEAGEVPLGTMLDETKFAFSPDLSSDLEEMILLTQSRFCFIDDRDRNFSSREGIFFAESTGDLVRRNKGKIFFYGRTNDVVKKFGERVDLSRIELAASKLIPSVSCIYMKKKIVLFCKTDDDSLIGTMSGSLKNQLKPSEVPDDIRRISFFPLSQNGKICKQQLKDIYKDFMKEDRERGIEAEDSFLEAINQILSLSLGKTTPSGDEPDGKRMKTEMDLTFKGLGGSSFDALRISMKLEDQTGMSNGLLPKLLSDRESIREICIYLKDLKPNVTQKTIEPHRAITSNVVSEIVKRFDLGKCVDASPAIIKTTEGNFVTVGSHSHKLLTIDAKNLTVVSSIEIGDRIESEVTAIEKSQLVGCYDGHLYSVNIQSGSIEWKFNSNGMIKSKALIVDNLIIFGNYNYDSNLWCLRTSSNKPELKWKKLVGSRGILATPLLVNEMSVLICTLDGTIELITLEGETIWSKKLESPIFSSPQIIPNREEVIIAEVSKYVHCVDFNGNFHWNFSTDGHIFSSFLFHQESDSHTKILFGCHDKKLRCLNYNHKSKVVSLLWSTELQSQIYGSPRMVLIEDEGHFVVSCATSGFINFIKLNDGSYQHTHKLPGEIFSTPAISERILFVGCRDNFLYCIQF